MITGPELKANLEQANLVSFDYDLRGSRILMPNGWSIRKKIFSNLSDRLLSEGYEEICIPSLVPQSALQRMDSIYPISNRYLRIENSKSEIYLCATHEAAFFSFLGKYLKKRRIAKSELIKFFFISPAFRPPKKSEAPFGFGERNSFLQIFLVTSCNKLAQNEAASLYRALNEFTVNELMLPVFNAIRPRLGNTPLCKTCYVSECVLASGRSLGGAMVYDQSDMFTNAFLPGRYKDMVSIHGGVTDNVLYSFFSTHGSSSGFLFPSAYTPYHVDVSYLVNNNQSYLEFVDKLKIVLELAGIPYKLVPRSTRSTGKQLKKSRFNGIPVLVSVDSSLVNFNSVWVTALSGSGLPVKCDINQLPQLVQRYISIHDKQICSLTMRDSSLVSVNTMPEINDAIKSGKIAVVDTNRHNDNISSLIAGEVLGSHFVVRCGQDGVHFFDQNLNRLYIGRRV